MADAGASGASAEPAIGYQGDGFAHTCPSDGRGGRQSLSHSRTSFGPFVSYHHHISWLYLSSYYAGHRSLFAIIDYCRAGMDEHGWGYCGLLDHGSLRGQAAKEYGYAPFGMHRFIDSAYDTGVGEGLINLNASRFSPTLWPVTVSASRASRERRVLMTAGIPPALSRSRM